MMPIRRRLAAFYTVRRMANFDADAKTNPNVLNAMIRLGNWLKHTNDAKTITT